MMRLVTAAYALCAALLMTIGVVGSTTQVEARDSRSGYNRAVSHGPRGGMVRTGHHGGRSFYRGGHDRGFRGVVRIGHYGNHGYHGGGYRIGHHGGYRIGHHRGFRIGHYGYRTGYYGRGYRTAYYSQPYNPGYYRYTDGGYDDGDDGDYSIGYFGGGYYSPGYVRGYGAGCGSCGGSYYTAGYGGCRTAYLPRLTWYRASRC